MACESGQGCGSGGEGSCNTDSCGSESSACNQTKPTLIFDTSRPRLCTKCKEKDASVNELLCASCLHTSLVSKFKTAVNKNSLVMPSDNVLLAFSGGPASRVALEFLREIRSKAQTDMDASREQGQSVFGLGVVFVNDARAQNVTGTEAQCMIDEITSIVSSDDERPLPLHIEGLQDVFNDDDLCTATASDMDHGLRTPEQKLEELLKNVEDVTGKEDLVSYLRMQVLQKVAKDHGYTKLALGVCTSRIAAWSIAATAKGQGFSFPADINYMDARWPVPVVLPLRDCLARELLLHCQLSKLKIISTKTASHSGDTAQSINSLSETFVSLLQEQNSSREYTITRTMGKLKPFTFNIPPPSPIEVALRRREKSRNGNESLKIVDTSTINNERVASIPDLLCPICRGPLDARDFIIEDRNHDNREIEARIEGQLIISNERDGDAAPVSLDAFKTVCCPSCRFQIFSKKPSKAENMYGSLPTAIKEQGMANLSNRRSWMRSQIQGYILSDD